MRVLHLPQNIAAQITITVRALRENGVQARGISPRFVIMPNDVVEFIPDFPKVTAKSAPLVWATTHLARTKKVLQAIMWADVVHWHFQPALLMALDLWVAKALKKRVCVEFWGSEIRIPQIEVKVNPYYAKVWQQGAYPTESEAQSLRAQRRFAQICPTVFVPDVQMLSYVDRALLPDVRILERRICLQDYEVAYPGLNKPKPVVMHVPSLPIVKGTPAVEAAVAALAQKFDFEYRSMTGVTYDKAMQAMAECDIYVDQLVLGVFGLAAIQAMAYGKPVVCYMLPAMRAALPDMPIIDATQENLPEVLERLIKNPQLRYEIGLKSRAWVEQHHNAHKIAGELIKIYTERR